MPTWAVSLLVGIAKAIPEIVAHFRRKRLGVDKKSPLRDLVKKYDGE